MKRIAIWAAVGLLLSVLLLSGCAMREMQADTMQSAELPKPQQTRMDMPEADIVPSQQLDVELYMASADGAMLIPVAYRLSVDYTQDDALMLMEALLSADEAGLVNTIPQGTRVLNLEHSGSVVTVDLSIDAYDVASARELLMMDAAIARTLGSLEDVQHVNLLIGGRKYSIHGLTMGALNVDDADLTLLWARASTEADYVEKGAGSYVMNRSAVVYYPAITGSDVLPVSVPVSYADGGAMDALMQRLSMLPEGIEGARAAFAGAPQYEAYTVVTENGRRVIRIDLDAETWNAMQQDSPGMSCAAAALTLVSFLPEVDGVAFCCDGMLITEFDLDGEIIRPETGVLTREALRSRIGTAVKLYYAADDGDGLKCVTRILSPMVHHYPRMLLSMLVEGPSQADEAKSAIPEGIGVADVLGIALKGDVMQVNLSANFYRLCQTLDEAAERRLVYSIVNTLCGLDGVSAVQFFVEGGQAEVLSEGIYICVPLMPNPGLAAQETEDMNGESEL